MTKLATVVAAAAVIVALASSGCAGGSAANTSTNPRVSEAQVLALARLDRPDAPAAGQLCVANWLRAHLPETKLARYVRVTTPEEGLMTPGLPSALLTANTACSRQLDLGAKLSVAAATSRVRPGATVRVTGTRARRRHALRAPRT